MKFRKAPWLMITAIITCYLVIDLQLPKKGEYRISRVHEQSSDSIKYLVEIYNGFDFNKGITWTMIHPVFNTQSEALFYAESFKSE